MKYNYKRFNWRELTYDKAQVDEYIKVLCDFQNNLINQVESLEKGAKDLAYVRAMERAFVNYCHIGGDNPNETETTMYVARRLHIGIEKLIKLIDHEVQTEINISRNKDRFRGTYYAKGIFSMMIDATQKYDEPLTIERIRRWHSIIYYTSSTQYRGGQYRDDSLGIARITMDYKGKEKIIYVAPPASVIEDELTNLIDFINSDKDNLNPVIKAAIARLWFLSIHPFDFSNEVIANAITDMVLAKHDKIRRRYYSYSAAFLKDDYYLVLKRPINGYPDITEWIKWIAKNVYKSLKTAEELIPEIYYKAAFWRKYSDIIKGENKKVAINYLLEGPDRKLSTEEWSKLTGCTLNIARRDTFNLATQKILIRTKENGTYKYSLNSLNF